MSKGFIPLFVIAAGFLVNYFLQWSRSAAVDYRCESCAEIFSLPVLSGAIAPHRFGGRKWVRCPRCGSFSWVAPVSKRQPWRNPAPRRRHRYKPGG